MVVQREKPVSFSGYAPSGHHVTVAFADVACTTTADSTGEWRVSFPAMPACNESRSVSAKCLELNREIVLEDVLVGEVWLCSGQSNMEMPVWSEQPFWFTANAEAEVAAADHPLIRFFDTIAIRDIAPKEPKHDLNPGAGWRPCTPETVRNFSACGYFFGRQLQADQNVPIGLIAAYWGGTDIAAWISAEKMESSGWAPFRSPKPSSRECQEYHATWRKYIQEYADLQNWLREFEEFCNYPREISDLYFDDSQWPTCPDGRPKVPRPGRYAHRLTFELPDELAGRDITITLGRLDDVDTTYFNGQQIGHTSLETPEYWWTIRKYQVPAAATHAGQNVVTVIHDNHFNSGTCAFTTVEIEVIGQRPHTVYPIVRSTVLKQLPSDFPPRPAIQLPLSAIRAENGPNAPNTLYNANVAPLVRYPLRGVIWYQGCNNAGELSYYQLHKMLIEDWREKWNDPEMPFLIVQLAAFEEHRPYHRLPETYFADRPIPEYPPYAVTREIQARMVEEYRNVGAIVAFDCGDHSDIHPRDKQTIGYRLAKKAEQLLENSSIVADGPTFAGIRLELDKIRVFFKHTGSGLTTTDGEAPKGFMIGDRNGRLVWAKAVIEGNTVVVSSPEIPEPQRVRYAFISFCKVNLCNREGFAAMPFRSDTMDYRKMLASASYHLEDTPNHESLIFSKEN